MIFIFIYKKNKIVFGKRERAQKQYIKKMLL